MKKTEFKTKRKAANEANATEADELIKDFLERSYLHDAKTQKLLEEYLENKDKNIDQ